MMSPHECLLAAVDIETTPIYRGDIERIWMIGVAIEVPDPTAPYNTTPRHEYFDVSFPEGVTKDELAMRVADPSPNNFNLVRLKNILSNNVDVTTGATVVPVFHNAAFDLRHLTEAGFTTTQYWHDSMLCMAELYGDVEPINGAKHSLYAWGLRGWCDLKEEPPDFTTWSVRMVGYNKTDCCATAQLARRGLVELIKDRAAWGAYTNIDLPFVWKLIELNRNGILIDTNAAAAFAHEAEAKVEGLLTLVRSYCPCAPGKKLGDTVKPRGNLLPGYEKGMRFGSQHIGWAIPEGQAYDERKKRIVYKARELEAFNPQSASQKAWMMQTYFPTYQPSAVTAQGTPSTDAEELDRLSLEPEAGWVAFISDYIAYKKLLSTYVDALLNLTDSKGRLYAEWFNATVRTGRLSSRNPPLQTLPSGDIGIAIRKAVVPPKGHKLVVLDLSQIELRILAWYLKYYLGADPEYPDALAFWTEYQKLEADVHNLAAQAIFGVAEPNNKQRQIGKKSNFSDIYGIGAAKFARDMRMSVDEATEILRNRHKNMPSISRLKEIVWSEARLHKDNAVYTLYGRRGVYPDITSNDKGLRARAERQAFNFKIQGTAGNILSLGALAATKYERLAGARLLLQVHDELVWEVPEGNAEYFSGAVQQLFEQGGYLPGLPVLAGVKVVDNYGEAK